jgi:hypothetical protein
VERPLRASGFFSEIALFALRIRYHFRCREVRMSIDRETPLPPPQGEIDDGSTVPAGRTSRRRRGRNRKSNDPSFIWHREPRASDDPIRMAGLLPPIPALMVIVGSGGNIVAASRHLREMVTRPLLGQDLDSFLEMPGGIVWLEEEPSDTLIVEGAKLVLGDRKRLVTLHGGWRTFEGERLFFALFELQAPPGVAPESAPPADFREPAPAF